MGCVPKLFWLYVFKKEQSCQRRLRSRLRFKLLTNSSYNKKLLPRRLPAESGCHLCSKVTVCLRCYQAAGRGRTVALWGMGFSVVELSLKSKSLNYMRSWSVFSKILILDNCIPRTKYVRGYYGLVVVTPPRPPPRPHFIVYAIT